MITTLTIDELSNYIKDIKSLLSEQRLYWIQNPLKRTKDFKLRILESRNELEEAINLYNKRLIELKNLAGFA